MKPYYDHAGITLYHGDSREVLPALDPVDVVLTDPPWELSGRALEIGASELAPLTHKSSTLKRGAVGDFDPETLRLSQQKARHDCLFLCGYKELGQVIAACDPLRGVFGWHKPNGVPAVFYPAKVDLSFIVWTAKKSLLYGRQHWPSMVFSVPFPSAGCMGGERYLAPGGGKKSLHPCQGPIALYTTLLRPFPRGLTVLDPYAGTGTTLRAAKDLGLKAIGVEVEERWCELIARRLEQEVFAFKDTPE